MLMRKSDADEMSGDPNRWILYLLQLLATSVVQQPEYVNELSSNYRQSLRVSALPPHSPSHSTLAFQTVTDNSRLSPFHYLLEYSCLIAFVIGQVDLHMSNQGAPWLEASVVAFASGQAAYTLMRRRVARRIFSCISFLCYACMA